MEKMESRPFRGKVIKRLWKKKYDERRKQVADEQAAAEAKLKAEAARRKGPPPKTLPKR